MEQGESKGESRARGGGASGFMRLINRKSHLGDLLDHSPPLPDDCSDGACRHHQSDHGGRREGAVTQSGRRGRSGGSITSLGLQGLGCDLEGGRVLVVRRESNRLIRGVVGADLVQHEADSDEDALEGTGEKKGALCRREQGKGCGRL